MGSGCLHAFEHVSTVNQSMTRGQEVHEVCIPLPVSLSYISRSEEKQILYGVL